MITHANSSNHFAIQNHVLDWSTIRRAAYFGLCPRHSTHVTPCYFCFWSGYFTKWVTFNQYKQRSWQGFFGSHFSHSFFSFLHFLLVCFTVHIRTLFINTSRSPEVSQVSPQLITNAYKWPVLFFLTKDVVFGQQPSSWQVSCIYSNFALMS